MCKKENSNTNQQIEVLKAAGFLKSDHVKYSEHPMTPFLESFYKTKLNSLTLQVTSASAYMAIGCQCGSLCKVLKKSTAKTNVTYTA